ncbi:MAG: CDGSH iron-sulfur domain-containing protein [Gracilimonas sp.]|uniref:CDGSH iron-sulfur domain-containing protein n=1 Tax=Gracilimonas sp. TaxID=1974203 RepID=UPI0019C23D7A|nr:CDGSH iron-sulfur domain-containing protein [Gracilimonas sp.]MBD3617270.1 CDGSH iron-sulfur domain-containing protein [Gracilimonas sp.]
MKEKILQYSTDELKVTWDKERCIHAAECVRGLPGVFDPKRKPWIKPELASADELTEVIERCPTGALHYELKSSDKTETPPGQNIITIEKDGPIYIHGEVVVKDMDENIVLKDTRMALCRCGQSKNKPLCDNSHISANFKADTSYNAERLRVEPVQGKGGELSVKLIDNAPFVVEGNYDLVGEATGRETCSKKMSFCRCGGSETKPFCDGTHKKIGFVSD